MIRKLIIGFSLLGLLVACNQSTVFNSTKKYESLVWESGDVPEFTVPVDVDSVNYNFIFLFRYSQGFPVSDVKVTVNETNPKGETVSYPLIFSVKDENGEYIGDGSGDIWDLEVPFKQNIKLEKGSYTFSFEQETSDRLPLVMEVGVKVEIVE